MKRRIVLLGPPASGKGTQAHLIFQKYGIPAISTGHLLRDEAAAGTELGHLATSYTSKGKLAPDDLVMAVLEKWLGGGREFFVFDGFPRTLHQAERLLPILQSKSIPLDLVLFLDCDLETIKERVLGRVTCSGCKTIYSTAVDIKLSAAGCPKCGGELLRRTDDTLEVLEQRMIQYTEKTAPLIEFYRRENLMVVIKSNTCAEEVFKEIEDALNS